MFNRKTWFEKASSLNGSLNLENPPLDLNLQDLIPNIKQIHPLQLLDKPSELEEAILNYTVYVVLPTWFVPAVLDYIMHRKSDIEHTSGTIELVSHNLMMLEIGAPVLMLFLVEVNPLVLTILAGAFLVHEVTDIWDVSIAAKKHRHVSQTEQHIHSFMEVMPYTTFSLFAILHWDQVKALFGQGLPKGSWGLHWKKSRLSARYLAAIMMSIGLFSALPYLEELQRCLKVAAQAKKSEESRSELTLYSLFEKDLEGLCCKKEDGLVG